MSIRKYPHFANCKCGKKGVLTPQDEWWVDAPEYHNCFWVYFKHNSRSHTLLEISKLLRLSISTITSIEKKALNKFKKNLKRFIVKP